MNAFAVIRLEPERDGRQRGHGERGRPGGHLRIGYCADSEAILGGRLQTGDAAGHFAGAIVPWQRDHDLGIVRIDAKNLVAGFVAGVVEPIERESIVCDERCNDARARTGQVGHRPRLVRGVRKAGVVVEGADAVGALSAYPNNPAQRKAMIAQTRCSRPM